MKYVDMKVSAMSPELLKILQEARPTKDSMAVLRQQKIDLESDPEFVAGYLKMQFVEDIHKAMEMQGLKPATLAKKMKKSRQYVGRVLNETANFTLETLAEIACTLGMRVAARMYSAEQRLIMAPRVSKPNLHLLSDYRPENTPVRTTSGARHGQNLAS